MAAGRQSGRSHGVEHKPCQTVPRDHVTSHARGKLNKERNKEARARKTANLKSQNP